MPYILTKTNGEKLATIADGALYLDTDLTFVGKNYSGYGEILNQNLLKLLENFSNSSAPTQPLRGQLWYDYSQKKLKVYSGSIFKTMARLEYGGNTAPSDASLGDLWWDGDNLKIYTESGFFSISGSGSSINANSTGQIVDIVSSTALDSTDIPHQILKHTVNDIVVAVTASEQFTLKSTDILYGEEKFTIIKKGLTLAGTNSITGSSTSTGFYLWGTASDSLKLNGLPATSYAKISDIPNYTTSTYSTLTVLTTLTTSVLQSSSPVSTIKGSWVIDGTLQARYADVAERYYADGVYAEGTVLVIGGDKEVTISTKRADPSVAGVVSTKYAYLLNADAGENDTHPAIALVGRIPCYVVGPVTRGESLVSSSIPGHAESWKNGDSVNSIIGKALVSTDKEFDIIEIKV